MTSRLLLTLLALLTGLAAQASPAQARAAAAQRAEVGYVLNVAEVRQERLRASLSVHIAAVAEAGRAVRIDAVLPAGVSASPGARMRIDRARE